MSSRAPNSAPPQGPRRRRAPTAAAAAASAIVSSRNACDSASAVPQCRGGAEWVGDPADREVGRFAAGEGELVPAERGDDAGAEHGGDRDGGTAPGIPSGQRSQRDQAERAERSQQRPRDEEQAGARDGPEEREPRAGGDPVGDCKAQCDVPERQHGHGKGEGEPEPRAEERQQRRDGGKCRRPVGGEERQVRGRPADEQGRGHRGTDAAQDREPGKRRAAERRDRQRTVAVSGVKRAAQVRRQPRCGRPLAGVDGEGLVDQVGERFRQVGPHARERRRAAADLLRDVEELPPAEWVAVRERLPEQDAGRPHVGRGARRAFRAGAPARCTPDVPGTSPAAVKVSSSVTRASPKSSNLTEMPGPSASSTFEGLMSR